MTTILGISGSLRAQSFNTTLLRAAQSLVAPDITFEAATLHGFRSTTAMSNSARDCLQRCSS